MCVAQRGLQTFILLWNPVLYKSKYIPLIPKIDIYI